MAYGVVRMFGGDGEEKRVRRTADWKSVDNGQKIKVN